MTKKDALSYAINAINAINVSCDTEPEREVIQILQKMIDQLSQPRKSSDEAKAKAKAKRADARAALMAQVLPIIRESVAEGGTAKEIFERCADALPEDFTSAKVQYILLHELADEVVKTEVKGKANTYTLR